MKLVSSRSLEEMRSVFLNPEASGPDPVYQVFDVSKDNSWINQTVIAHGRYGDEYPKTFGHYHGTPVPEIYVEVQGEGILLLQKKHFENDVWVPEMVDEVILIKAKHNDKIIITPEYGHSWSNIGNTDLVSYDDWHKGHTPADYEMIQKLHGMAYYLTSENGEVKPVPNPNYEALLHSSFSALADKNLPEPKWLTSEEFSKR